MDDKLVPCLCCNKQILIRNAIVNDATTWLCWGNYGSRVYDPSDGSRHLEIFICDECLVKNKNSIIEVETVVEKTEKVLGMPDF